MMTEENRKKADQLNRRSFIRKTAGTGIGAAAVLAGAENVQAALKPQSKKGFSPFRQEYDSIDDIYDIAPDYKRMHQKNIIFARGVWSRPLDKPEGKFWSFFAKWTQTIANSMDGEPGFSPLEHALNLASWASVDTGTPFTSGGMKGLGVFNDWNRHSNPKVFKDYKFKTPVEASKYIKRASNFLGADMVGIAPFDERWVYSKWIDYRNVIFEGAKEPLIEDAVFPFKPKSVIAIGFQMDRLAMSAPGYLMDTAAGLEYSHMAEVGHRIAVFLNHLGYKAIPAGNDTAMSIPIAAQAGLGELSRMGTLINEKYGSGIRLAKVYTDLEITPDKPVTFGVQEFCKKCKKCATHCPSNAISVEDEPSDKPNTGSISSHPGVTKWYQNNEKCFGQWEKDGAGCGICLHVCPYNKMDTWVHDLAKLAVGVPIGRDIARQLDDAFGYGRLEPGNVQKFWDKAVD